MRTLALLVLASTATAAPLKVVPIAWKETDLHQRGSAVLASGKTVIVIDDRARRLGKKQPLVDRPVRADLSAIGADSVILRTTTGMVVLRVPQLTPLYRSDTAEEIHYAGERTIAFVDGGAPMLLDTATGKARVAGTLPDYGCLHREDGSTCATGHWGAFVGVDGAGRWVIEDLITASGLADRIRLVDPASGETTVLAESKKGWVAAQVSDGYLCVERAVKDSATTHKDCGPIGGASVVSTAASSVSFVGPHLVAIVERTTLRLVDLETKTTRSFEGIALSHLRLVGDYLFAAEGIVDLAAGTFARATDIVAIDPTDPHHVWLTGLRDARF